MQPITIVIPALNEQEGLPKVIDAIYALHIDAEVVVVDDGSTDATGQVAREKYAKVVRHPMPMGYGHSLKDGIRAATRDIIVITDADGTYPIHRIPDLVTKFEEGYDCVVGARSGPEYRGSFFKMPARWVFKFLAEFTAGRRIADINSGLRVFRKSTIEPYFGYLCETFSFTTTQTLVYMLNGKSVGYLDIDYGKRAGKSKVKIVHDALRTLQYLTETIVRFNPIKAFLMLALLTFVFSLIIGEWAFGVLISILIFAMGLAAESRRQR